MTAPASPWLTVDEAKAYARCGKNHIYSACRTGVLAARQSVAPQGKWLIHRDDLDAWLRADTKPVRRRA
ncbi:MAG: DNA-binding protein [Hyphomicrobiales bacterium]|nr:MAG: DNA-binding protein [Hyphomicrobiales bacterium]